jgi:sulfatase maturation enzyme AslB (radical SAM superfamily)
MTDTGVERVKRRVSPYWWPPTLIARQAASAFLIGTLTRWRKLPQWFLDYGFKCLPGAGGSRGMGCIGFPDHPVWEMTSACNLNCVHCHTAGGKPGNDELNTDEAKHLLNDLARVDSFRMMAFTGGEPLMRPDLFELLAHSRALGFNNTVATNATLIDDGIAQRLRNTGVVIAAVSLDGIKAETHDRIRGLPGSFEQAVQGMRALTRAGILLHINITAMEYNVKQLERLMALVDGLNTGILLIYQLVPVGRGRVIEDAVLDKSANNGAGGRTTVLAFSAEAGLYFAWRALMVCREGFSWMLSGPRVHLYQARRCSLALSVCGNRMRQCERIFVYGHMERL